VATQKFLNSGTANFIYIIPNEKLKELLGFRPWESGPLQIILDRMDDPGTALEAANKIQALLKPGIAGYYGDFIKGRYVAKGEALVFYTNSESFALIEKNLPLSGGSWDLATNTNSIAISDREAQKLTAGTGQTIIAIYENKFGGETTNRYKVGAIFSTGNIIGENVMLIAENNFYRAYLQNLPLELTNYSSVYIPSSNNILSPALGTEWKLLPRTYNAEALDKKLRKTLKEGFEGPCYDVSTMYESASFVLDMQSALDSVSLAAVMILFFVILIGVLNTLRMTIRERTREIGTIRAIGMQKEDVKTAFILETFYLTFISCVAGIILSAGILFLISLVPVETDSMFGMFLIDRRIHFILSPGKPGIISILILLFILEGLTIRFDKHIPGWFVSTAMTLFVLAGFFLSGQGNGIITFLILILNMLTAIAYFPARRAANLPAAEALRRYE
jgi:ABC-type lipoprotein release transport system permease subunit